MPPPMSPSPAPYSLVTSEMEDDLPSTSRKRRRTAPPLDEDDGSESEEDNEPSTSQRRCVLRERNRRRGGGRGRARGGGRSSTTANGLASGDELLGGQGRSRGSGRGRGVGCRGRGKGEKAEGGRAQKKLEQGQIYKEPAGPYDEEETLLRGEWKKIDPTCERFAFSGPTPGPTTLVDGSETALDLFLRFFTHEALDLIVTETNRYADQCREDQTASRDWTPTDRRQVMALLGMIMVMGLCRLPEIGTYWENAWGYPIVRDVMTLMRYQQLLRYFHLNDSSKQVPPNQPGFDALYRCEHAYNIHEQVSVDEAMIPFKGRLSFIQHMKDKPTKWGIKVFILADATNGYVKRLQLYTGKNSELSRNELGLCTNVVLELLSDLEHTHPKVYMDNYYTSSALFVKLYLKGINACGTIRTSRKWYPKDLIVQKDRKHQRGFYDYRSCGPLGGYVWVDSRPVNMLSSMHSSSAPATVNRRREDGTRGPVLCPPALPEYLQFMRGIDVGDQMMSYYYAGRRSLKWWKRVFSYLVEVCSWNAYLISGRKGKRGAYFKFRKELALALIGNYTCRSRPGRPRVLSQGDVLPFYDEHHKHLPRMADARYGKSCVVCSAKKLRHETKVFCVDCKVHLCIQEKRDCYSIFHTKLRREW